MKHLNVPLSVKVRLLPYEASEDGDEDDGEVKEEGDDDDDDDDYELKILKKEEYKRNERIKRSIKLYTKLVDAGIHLLTIHGRTRYMKGQLIKNADWDAIKQVVDLLGHKIPIFANGSIQNPIDIINCLKATNADGIMSSESVLEYPPIFNYPNILQYYNNEKEAQQNEQEEKTDTNDIMLNQPRTIGRLQIAKEYMELAKKYPPNKGGQGSGLKCIRMHIHRFLHADLQNNPSIRQLVVSVDTTDGLQQAINQIATIQQTSQNQQEGQDEDDQYDVSKEELSWYVRHRHNEQAEREKLEKHIASGIPALSVEDEQQMQSVSTSLFGGNNNDDDGDY